MHCIYYLSRLQLQLTRHIHIKCWFSGRVTRMRHCTYSQSQKVHYLRVHYNVYIITLPVKHLIRVLFWHPFIQSAYTWSVRTLKAGQAAHDYLVILVIIWLH